MRRIALLLPLTLAFACGEKDGTDSGGVDADGDGVAEVDDCDDDNADVYPGNAEICDGLDNDCNDQIDDGVKLTFYADIDGDGYGDAADAEEGCFEWGDYIEDDTDCDDGNPDIHPGATEDDCADPVDYNCDGSVQYADADGDSWAACEDCDDNNSTINPDAEEECDYLDNNCDGTVDEGSAIDADTFYADLDGDGYGDEDNTTTACHDAPSGYTADLTDCDDDNALTYPGADEVCDAADNDCDGDVGEALVPTDYATIQDGVDSGETFVCIEAGTYTENVFISGTTDLVLAGVGSASVIIDGGGADRTVHADSTNSNLTLAGITVQNGYIDDDFGAGLFVEGGDTVTLDDIVSTGNSHDNLGFGHAVALGYMDELVVTDLEIHTNEALGGTSYGALGVIEVTSSAELDGIHIHDNTSADTTWGMAAILYANESVSVTDLTVTDNTHDDDGASVYAPVVTFANTYVGIAGATITGNTLDTSFNVAGGLFSYQDGEADFALMDIRGNATNLQSGTSSQFGGGLVTYYPSTSATVTNSIVAGNTTTEDAPNAYVYGGGYGAFGDATATNLTVHGNSATVDSVDASGVSCGYGTLTLVNSTITGNYAVATSLLGEGVADIASDCTVAGSYNNVYGNDNGEWDADWTDPTGTDGNISSDAGYTDVTSTTATDWDLTLATGSALIDAGDPAILDADDTTSDIGAYGGPDGDNW